MKRLKKMKEWLHAKRIAVRSMDRNKKIKIGCCCLMLIAVIGMTIHSHVINSRQHYLGDYSEYYNGVCGDNVTYHYDERTHALTIEGNGIMYDYPDKYTTPWYKFGSSIYTIVIREGVRSVGAYNFAGLCNIMTVTIPATVTEIGDYAFYDCSDLNKVRFPSMLRSIGKRAFQSCSSLKSVTLPDNGLSVGEEAFENINVTRNNMEDFVDDLQEHVQKEESQPYLSLSEADDSGKCGENVFWYYFKDTRTLVIKGEGEVKEFEERRKYNISSVVVMDGITKLGKHVFHGCDNLKNITLPKSLVSIGERAFMGCDSLKSINIPEGVTNICQWAFHDCYALKYVNLPSTLKVIDGSFSNTGIETITIPDGVTTLGEGTFYGCKFKSINIPKNVSYIGKKCFSDCYRLQSVNIPEKVTTIKEETFRDCYALESIIIPENIKKIEDRAFEHCKKLVKVTIGSNVSSIGGYAFAYCENLSQVSFLSENVDVEKNAFWDTPYKQYAQNENYHASSDGKQKNSETEQEEFVWTPDMSVEQYYQGRSTNLEQTGFYNSQTGQVQQNPVQNQTINPELDQNDISVVTGGSRGNSGYLIDQTSIGGKGADLIGTGSSGSSSSRRSSPSRKYSTSEINRQADRTTRAYESHKNNPTSTSGSYYRMQQNTLKRMQKNK